MPTHSTNLNRFTSIYVDLCRFTFDLCRFPKKHPGQKQTGQKTFPAPRHPGPGGQGPTSRDQNRGKFGPQAKPGRTQHQGDQGGGPVPAGGVAAKTKQNEKQMRKGDNGAEDNHEFPRGILRDPSTIKTKSKVLLECVFFGKSYKTKCFYTFFEACRVAWPHFGNQSGTTGRGREGKPFPRFSFGGRCGGGFVT